VRLDAAQERLTAANLELDQVTVMLETDRRLRALRASGTLVAMRVARIGDAVPHGVWLTSVDPSPPGFDVEGEAVNVGALNRILSNLLQSGGAQRTQLLRMARVARARGAVLVSFTLQLRDVR
jgi:hypothetical protein